MVKFGQTLIFQQSLQSLSEEVKKSEWTDNKFYKSATCVDARPKFDPKSNTLSAKQKDEAVNSLVGKLKTNKEVPNTLLVFNALNQMFCNFRD